MSAANTSMAGFPEAVRMSTAACSARIRSRPVIPTRAPIVASPIAVALPIPLVAPVTSTTLPAIGSASDIDHDLSSRVPRSDVIHRSGGLAQGVGPIDERHDLTGLDQLLEGQEIVMLLRHHKSAEPLAHETERHHRFDQPARAGEPTILELPAVWHKYPARGERAPQVGQRSVRDVVEDEVVTLAT